MKQNAKDRIQYILNYRRTPMWIAVVIIILLIVTGISLISNPEARSAYTYQEKSSMTTAWAEALKTRDGKPRYEMMSENMKEIFKEQQKLRSDVFNYNIGVSSPWVTDYEITVKENSAEIVYHMTDSIPEKYDKKEIIYFGKENGKTVVINLEELISEWERVGTNQLATGTYGFGRLLYLSPLSSSTFDYAESSMVGTKYTIGKDLFEIDYPNDETYKISKPIYTKEYINDDMIEAFEASTMGKLTVSEYKEKYRYNICTEENEKTNFCLYVMDDELWLASYVDNTADRSEIMMDVCRLK